MTDIQGLFAIVLCLYGCLRALQSATTRAAIGWLCFAVAANAICGTSRQIAWLGLLVIVPSALWLLRAQRRVLLAGAVATLAGTLFILACILWLRQQPHLIPEHLLVGAFPVGPTFAGFIDFLLDIPFLLLPIVVLFLPEIRKSTPRVLAALFLGYLFVAVHPRHPHHIFLLEPTGIDWVGVHGIYEDLILKGIPPIFLHSGVQVVLTIVSFSALLGLIASFIRTRRMPPPPEDTSTGVSWKQLSVLLMPFTIAYTLILIPRAATTGVYDRYLLELLVVALICFIRYYQDRIQPRLPLASVLLVGIMAIYSIAVVHNLFALYRARVAIAAEILAAGIPDTFVDNGWEYNLGVELHHADFINDYRIVLPAHAYVPAPPPPAGACEMFWYDETPHIHPLYGISFDPNACYGPAPFAPIKYSRWLASHPGTLYVVRYTNSTKP